MGCFCPACGRISTHASRSPPTIVRQHAQLHLVPQSATHMLAPATARQDGTQVTQRPGLSLRGWRAGLQLALVLRLIVVPLRLRDQAIGTHCPFFVPLDPNGLASAPTPPVLTGPDPPEDSL